MRKLKLLSAMISCIVCIVLMGIVSSAAEVKVKGSEGIVTAEETDAIYDAAKKISNNTGWNIDVYITDGKDFYDEDECFRWCVNTYEDDFGDDTDGILFLCDTDWVYLITSGSATKYIRVSEAESIARYGDSAYKSGDIVRSAKLVLQGAEQQYYQGEDTIFNNPEALVFCVAGGLIAALIAVVGIVSSYKTHAQPTVNNYLNSNTINFRNRKDVFVRTTTVTHHNSSSSGGGGRSGGGHHGGGGRR